GPDGSFILENIVPGEHVIDVRPRPDGNPAAANAADQEFASVPISVNGSNIANLVITTGVGATVSGRVIYEGTPPRTNGGAALRVMPTSPDPGSGMMVGNMMANNQSNGTVDDAGRFQIKGV